MHSQRKKERREEIQLTFCLREQAGGSPPSYRAENPDCRMKSCCLPAQRVCNECVCVCVSPYSKCGSAPSPCRCRALSDKYRRVALTQTAPGHEDGEGQVHQPRPPQRQCSQPHTLCPHPAVVTFSPPRAPPLAFSFCRFCSVRSCLQILSATARLSNWGRARCRAGGVARNAAADL